MSAVVSCDLYGAYVLYLSNTSLHSMDNVGVHVCDGWSGGVPKGQSATRWSWANKPGDTRYLVAILLISKSDLVLGLYFYLALRLKT